MHLYNAGLNLSHEKMSWTNLNLHFLYIHPHKLKIYSLLHFEKKIFIDCSLYNSFKNSIRHCSPSLLPGIMIKQTSIYTTWVWFNATGLWEEDLKKKYQKFSRISFYLTLKERVILYFNKLDSLSDALYLVWNRQSGYEETVKCLQTYGRTNGQIYRRRTKSEQKSSLAL